MNRKEFHSIFAPHIVRYIEYKEANGFKVSVISADI